MADPGKGFMLGQSGNPKGRVLVYETLAATNRLPEGEVIADQLERRARQHLEIADVTKRLKENRTQNFDFTRRSSYGCGCGHGSSRRRSPITMVGHPRVWFPALCFGEKGRKQHG